MKMISGLVRVKMRLGDELREKLESESYIRKVEEDGFKISFLGWKVISEVDNHFIMTNNALFKTTNKGWISEFYVAVIQILNKTVFLVDDDCPEYLFLDPTSLTEPICKFLKKTDEIMFGYSKMNENGEQ